jgi:hypothetical protein
MFCLKRYTNCIRHVGFWQEYDELGRMWKAAGGGFKGTIQALAWKT